MSRGSFSTEGDMIDVVEQIILSPEQDQTFCLSFLMTYKKRGGPEVLFQVLEEIYNRYKKKKHLLKNIDLDTRMNEFYRTWLVQCKQDISDTLREKIFAILRIRMNSREFLALRKTLVADKNKVNTLQLKRREFFGQKAKNRIMDQNLEEIAKQLTMIQWIYFSDLDSSELIGANTSSIPKLDEKKIRSPTLTNMTERFDKVSFWVASQILTCKTPQRQAQMIDRFVKILQHLIRMNNFETSMQIVSALDMHSVRRLKKTWKKVSNSSNETLSQMEKLLSPKNNYIEYRNYVKSKVRKGSPCLPWLAIVLKDLTYIAEGNVDLINGAINIDKMELEGRQVYYLQEKKRYPYTFPRDELLEAYLWDLRDTLDEEELYELSLSYQKSNIPNSPRDSSSTTATEDSSNLSDEEDSDSIQSSDNASTDSPRISTSNSELSVTEFSLSSVKFKCELNDSVKLVGLQKDFASQNEFVEKIKNKFELTQPFRVLFTSPNEDTLVLRTDWHMKMLYEFLQFHEQTSIKLKIVLDE